LLILRYPPSASTSSGRIELAKLGLTVEALSGKPHPIGFKVRREAGTFVCQGNAGDGRGDGAFWFRPDAACANAIAETGLPALTFRNHVVAGVFNVPSAFVKAIIALPPGDRPDLRPVAIRDNFRVNRVRSWMPVRPA
jgi:hypothetical protein